MLHLLRVVNNLCIVAVLLNSCPVSNKTILATTFDLERDALSVHDWLDDSHIDGACHSRTWLVEGLVHGHLHVALVAVSFFVSE